ncbi:MAG: c-type cytochrome [Pseudomonadota bacterium]
MDMGNQARVDDRWSFAYGKKRLITLIVLSLAALIAPQTASAQIRERSGKEVVDAVCAACHRTGVKGAPKIGDEKAWSQLASRGLTSLTESALKGVREMPAHGGNMALTDIEIERAISYMVNLSGGKWTEPLSGLTPAVERRGEQIVQAQCAKCHQTGVNSSPKIGDRDAWLSRLKRGLDVLVRSAIHGHGPMPPRGGMADLTDSEIRGAILYMYNPSQAPAEGRSTALPKARDPSHKVVRETEIYLGIVSAGSIRAQYAEGSPEGLMHGGVPSGKGYYHLNISLFDSKTRAAITDAQVEASTREPVYGGETKKLELMTLNNMKSYGNYFRMSSKNPYTITVRIQRPGVSPPIEAKFDYRP